jgi:hypothetical protein
VYGKRAELLGCKYFQPKKPELIFRAGF